MNLSRALLLAGIVLAGPVSAQGPEDTLPLGPFGPGGHNTSNEVQPSPTAPATLLADDLFVVPIHGGQDDNGYRYGTWASGARYKVSFHDGMAFYPVVGARYPNQPVAWTTAAVHVGSTKLLGAEEVATHAHGDWRYEYRYRALTEAYDVGKDGVEQSFTIHRRPQVAGDLVIRGTVTTELVATPRGFEHAPLAFAHPDGTAIVRYGEAFVIDAGGDREQIETAWDGHQISIRVPAGWLATAAFPIVVDPLFGNVLVSYDSGGRQASRPDVARDDVADELLTVYGRMNADGDYDAYARITQDDFSGTQTVWNDITASWSTRNCDIAFVGGANRWIIVIQRDFPSPTGSWIRFHTRASGDHALSSDYSTLAGSSGNTLTFPEVGGTYAYSSGNDALVVYQSDQGLANTPNSEVYAHVVNVSNNTHTAAINLEPGAVYDRETPTVNPESDGGSASWVCCWTQLNNSIIDDDWDLIICRIDSSGTVQGRDFLGDASSTVHAYQPHVAGRGGRYMVSFGQATNGSGTQLNGWAPSPPRPPLRLERDLQPGQPAPAAHGTEQLQREVLERPDRPRQRHRQPLGVRLPQRHLEHLHRAGRLRRRGLRARHGLQHLGQGVLAEHHLQRRRRPVPAGIHRHRERIAAAAGLRQHPGVSELLLPDRLRHRLWAGHARLHRHQPREQAALRCGVLRAAGLLGTGGRARRAQRRHGEGRHSDPVPPRLLPEHLAHPGLDSGAGAGELVHAAAADPRRGERRRLLPVRLRRSVLVQPDPGADDQRPAGRHPLTPSGG